MAEIVMPKNLYVLEVEMDFLLGGIYKKEERKRSTGKGADGKSYEDRYRRGDKTEDYVEYIMNILNIPNIKSEGLSPTDDSGVDFILTNPNKALIQVKSSPCGLDNFFKKDYLFKDKVYGLWVRINDPFSRRKLFYIFRDIFSSTSKPELDRFNRFIRFLETKQGMNLNGNILRKLYGNLIKDAIQLGFISNYSLDTKSYFVYPNQDFNNNLVSILKTIAA